MKKRIICILLTAVMLFTLIPITAFAADNTITNGTPESAIETNHGYITVDKTAAEKGETVTITVHPNEGYKLKSKSLTVVPTGFVDLGIKDAEGKPLYWKETNLGASNPQDPGDYYMWGATTLMYSAVDRSKTNDAFTFVTDNPYGDNYKNTWDETKGFNWDNIPFADGVFKNTDGEKNVFTKYTTIDEYAKSGTPDNITTLQHEDDAATAKNANWHTPTYDEFVALATNCVLVWTSDYNSTGNAGYIVYKAKNDADKGKANINGTWKMWDAANSKYIANTGSEPTGYSTSDIHIFLPAAGIGFENKLNNLNIGGVYWSGTLGSNNDRAYTLTFMKGGISLSQGQRLYGYSVRPVMSAEIILEDAYDGTYQFTMPGYAVTVTAEFEVTIADILPSNFPASDQDNSWCKSENDNIYIYKTDSDLVFNDSIENIYNIPLSSPLTKQENPKVSYVYSKDGTEIQFNMTGDNNDELDSIIVSDCTTNTSCIGTYAAPEEFSVTYNANGATSGTVPAAQTKIAGVDLTLATNTGNLAKEGYTFAGWNTKADGSGTHYDIEAAYKTDAALTLYAKWIEAPTPKTIAEILPKNFPTYSDGIPSNAWKNSAGSKMYINNNGLTFGGVNLYSILTKPVTEDGNNYKYTSDSYTITFVMNSNQLVKIIIAGADANYNGEYIPSHTHSFTYTVNNGKQLTATCEDGCDKGYDTTPLTLTLTAPSPSSLVYDRNAKTVTFADGEEDKWTTAGLQLPTITYTAKSGSSLTDGKAINAGSYTASITVDTNKTASLDFEITKATPHINKKPAPSDINYGQKLADSTLFGGKVQASTTDSTQVGGQFNWTNPETIPAISDSDVTLYDVTFTPVDETNYNTVSCQVTITVNHTHSPVLVNGQDPTEDESGWKDYYECICGEFYEDATGNVKIPDLNAWKAEGGNGYIAKLEPAPEPEPDPDPINYKVIEGANSVWVIAANENPVFRSNADFSKFSHVLLDGKELAKKYYKAESGSTIITLTPEFTATLSVGKHTIEIVSTDGSASTVFYIEETIANTNGEGFALSTATMSSAFIGCNIVGLAVVFFKLKKKKKVR